MGTVTVNPVVPERVDLDWRHWKRQFSQYQLIRDAGDADKMARQDCQQVGVGHHFAGGKKLIDRDYHAPLTSYLCQSVVNKAKRAPGKTDQQVARAAIAVQRQCSAGQWVVTPHDADVVAAVHALVGVRYRRTRLCARRQIGEGGGEVANGQIDRLVL